MFRLFKRTVVTTLAVGLVAGLTFGTDTFSYLKTSYNRLTSSVSDSVPVEFQIDRARQMVHDLAPEVRRSMHVIAKEEIELDKLRNQIAKAETQAQESKEQIMRLQSDLGSGQDVFRYAGRSYSRNEVKHDLTQRFSRHKVADDTLAHLCSMRDARAANLEAAQKKLAAMMSAQKRLETDITNLETQRKLVEVAQASSDVLLDDSQLARAKDLIVDIRTRLDVAAKLANADSHYLGEIPLDEPTDEDVSDQVAAYFGGESAKAAKPQAELASVGIQLD
ncbi:hypothetical protein Mal64_23380 [Pseudobythopirellula maris]|uniref:Chromosome partition protein Smc n=1 Tax=Pseudobythopirellula maris TaxID=2527991 RepID=A0A5C5ZNT3_9BACT|nr:hypothetical protein [Pseudobythopirellula maris]TWT88850.1 hypothetical protein Mal64_23380 [Pseudobythopirellula maris]